MAYVCQLTDGTTTLNLLDETSYDVMEGGVNLPPPAKRQTWGGSGPGHDGSTLIESNYLNRIITVALKLLGTSDDDLTDAVRDINDLLAKAQDYSEKGRGAQVTFSLKLDAGADTIIFDVIDGELSLPRDWLGATLDKTSRIIGITLELVCKPFGSGTEVTLRNRLRNPGFELGDAGSFLHDWTATNATQSRDATGSPPEGTYWGKCKANCGGGQQGLISQSVTWDAAAYQGVTMYLRLKYKCPAANDREQRIGIYDGVTETISAVLTKDDAQHTLNISKAMAGGATELTVRVYANYVAGADVDDYILVDEAILDTLDVSAFSPWISGREVSNRNDPDNLDSADDINYVDIVGVGGDVPALLKLYCEEEQNQTRMVFGARHGSQARDSLYREQGGNADANASNQDRLHVTMVAGAGYKKAPPAITIATPPKSLFRVFARVNLADPDFTKIALGWTYGILSYTPSAAEYLANAGAAYYWYDLGIIAIPPIDLPLGETEPSFVVDIWGYQADNVNTTTGYVDVIMLFPCLVRDGYVAADHASATKRWLLNSDTGVFILTTAGVLDGYPTAIVGGLPATCDPAQSRVHLIAPGTQPLTDTFTCWAKVTPRYLLI